MGIFSPDKNTVLNPVDSVGKEPFAVCMPLFLNYTDDDDYNLILGGRDIDYNTEIKAYYSFEDNEIHNADKSVANFDSNLSSKELPYISEENLKLLKNTIPKNSNIVITELVCIKDKVAVATDLNSFTNISNVDLEDGLYEIVNGAFKGKLSGYGEVEDFPIDNYSYKKIGRLNASELSTRLSQLLPFIGKDEMRPVFNGATFIKQFGEFDIIGCVGSILYKSELGGNHIEDFSAIVSNPKLLAEAVGAMVGNVNIYKGDETILFVSDDDSISFTTRLIDAKIPDYNSVIPEKTDKVMSFNKKDVLTLINTLKGEDSKHQLVFEFENENKYGGYAIIKSGKYNIHEKAFENIKELDKIKCVIFNEASEDKSNIALLMPILIQDKSVVAFGVNYFKSLLSVCDDDNVRLHYDSGRDYPSYVVKLNSSAVKDTVEVINPNTDKEFNEAVFEQIQPHDSWIGHVIKERAVKQQIHKLVNDASPEDIEVLFNEYKAWFLAKNDANHNVKSAISVLSILAKSGDKDAAAAIKSLSYLI